MLSLGVDLVEVQRIRYFIDKKTSQQLLRVFTQKEINYSLSSVNKYQRFAVRFAVKEAFYKSFGAGNLSEIELIHENSKPKIILYGKTKQKWEQGIYTNIAVSVSHTDHYATATVIIT